MSNVQYYEFDWLMEIGHDAERLAEYYISKANHFRQWEPIREIGYYSESSLQTRLSDYEEQQRCGREDHVLTSLVNPANS